MSRGQNSVAWSVNFYITWSGATNSIIQLAWWSKRDKCEEKKLLPDQVFQEIPDQVLQTLRYLREKDDGLIMQELPDYNMFGFKFDRFRHRPTCWIWNHLSNLDQLCLCTLCLVCLNHLVVPAQSQKYSTQCGGVSGSSVQVLCCFPIVVFLSKVSLSKQPLTFLIATYPFVVVGQATVPHVKEKDKTFRKNSIALDIQDETLLFSNQTYIQP